MFYKEIIHRYDGLRGLPLKIYKNYWVEYIYGSFSGIFRIDGQEVVVNEGDYLVEYKGRLYYYPKDIYEARDNKEIISWKGELV